MKTSAKEEIIKRLQVSPVPLAIHEFKIIGVSDNSIGSRLPELAREGRVIGSRAIGKAYKVWSLAQ